MEILPKIDGLDGEDAIRRSLLAMLAKTRDLEVRDSEAAGFHESAEPFICVLARLHGRRLFEAVRFGLRQEYVAHDELLPVLRGKVHWPSQAKRQAAQRLEFRCLFDERSADTPLNRTLKEPLLALAKLLLGDRSPDLGRAATADRRSYAVVWDMNVLFEEYVGRACQDVFEPKGLDVDLQGGGRSGSASTREAPTSASRARTSTRSSPTPTATPPTPPSSSTPTTPPSAAPASSATSSFRPGAARGSW